MRTRGLYLIILVSVLVNSVLWLDSFERYLNGRYHLYLSQYLPEAAFIPSRILREIIAPDESIALNEMIEPPPVAAAEKAEPIAPVVASQPSVAETLAASGVEAASSVVAAEPQALALKAEIELPQAQAASGVSAASGVCAEAQEVAIADTDPRVLFAGDSMMQGVAPKVISRMRRDFPKGKFVDLSKPSTGLTARRYFDWPATIKEESAKHGIQVIVIFLGPNDPWDIYEGKKRYAFPTESWEDKYRSRVDEVLDFAVANKIRVIWIGLPAMREERIAQGAKIENRIFQSEVEKYKFDYLPTEDFLGSLDDPYTKYIDDPKKGKLAVRLDDGVHFTNLGLRMISARVDELLRKREKS